MSTSGGTPDGTLVGSPKLAGSAVLTANHNTRAAGANVAANAAIGPVAGVLTWVTMVVFTIGIATTALELDATITGLVGGTWTINLVGSLTVSNTIVIPFPVALPSSAVNTAITAGIPASGASGPAISTSIAGYTL